MYNFDFELLRRKQQICIKMLNDFDKLCREQNITYFISGGTLLGAVRHQGIIPWDDDVDVCMHANDIARLINCWNESADKRNYFLQTKETDSNIPNPFIRIRKNGTTDIDIGKEHVNIHWGISLDIFPIYNIPKRKSKFLEMRILHQVSRYASFVPYKFYWLPETIKNISTKITIKVLYRIKRLNDLVCNEDYLYCPFFKKQPILSKNIFYPAVDIKFENNMLLAPRKSKMLLEKVYGDYMQLPPEEERWKGHNTLVDLENNYSKYIKR